MTLDQFIAKLRKTPRRWYLDGNRIRSIKRGKLQHCPISAVAGNNFSSMMPVGASRHLGLSSWSSIVYAADHEIDGGTTGVIRRRLLRACGLTPPRTRAGRKARGG